MIIKKKYNQSNRHFKVTENIKKSISEILLRNELPIESSLNFPLTVIEVKMSDDIRHAYVYISTHEKLEEKEVLQKLKDSSHYIAKEMNKLVSMKFLPKLIFRFDKTSKNYEKIAELLNSEKVQEDLKK
ncbi:30S ribosome-binding factor RbfA [Pelagibacterales bacterium]|nr:30S ribosome-binding factor RbfA [Pelagibacterales bacterium]MBL6861845.1 30S ribosome-binding factor RbfA [Pelagibacterales bacterium]MDA7763437.1 30S ribosome-binding factor RbfA [Pelagibacterales bacterium]MDB4220106.1 30S ribosome-binding factor RbfA [Pelagibacterales bacterium]MDB9818236.1 30S ribosome-binding factor RbfA [Pelagibacterales bacterium]